MAAEASSPKKMKRVGDGTCSDFDSATQRALDELDNCQSEIDALNEKASEEILIVEQKYNKERKPLFEKRNNLINGVPNFWFTAIMNHPDLSAVMDESEEDCLHHLTKLEVEEFEDIKSGYRIKFYFSENSYFDNTVLTKEFHLGSGTPTSHSTTINWKSSTLGASQSNQPTTSKSRKRRFETTSFFTWFNDNVDPTTDDIAEIIKDDLWHNPLQYYLVPDMEEDNGMEEDDGSDSSVDLAEDTEDKSPNKGSGDGPSA